MGKVIMAGGGGGADTSVVTAMAPDVLEDKVIVGANGEPLTGTMPDNGAISQALNCGESYTIPQGYHDGSGGVTANSLASQTSATAAANKILNGYTAWVNGVKVTGNVSVNSVMSFSAAPYSTNQITFTWKNPAKGAFSGVIIRGKTGSYPTSITDGTQWYKGTGNNTTANGTSTATVSGFAAGTTYYFRAYSYAIKDNANWVSDTTYTATATPTKGTKTFTSSTTWTVPTGVRSIDIFCVGGGGSGMDYDSTVGCGGGGSGYTTTKKSVSVTPGQSATITIGAGGAYKKNGSNDGSATTCSVNGTTITAKGGFRGGQVDGKFQSGAGGCGGSGGATTPTTSGIASKGGENGSDETGPKYEDGDPIPKKGFGQGTTTKAFAESSGTLYAGGGGSGCYKLNSYGGSGGGGRGANCHSRIDSVAGTANTGGGGGGGVGKHSDYARRNAASGGSGICIVRWGY